ncbi:SEL1-like repeat protein [Vineibacter terrae]|uniref:SEL1-like repeat protein n=1 Tax=Vineibacter terrae TaxID=2586908 RepID=A0A5C8PRY1_9HYPH|nr:SEL1-like repeat protein [Vineibacter terrae]TXL78118.1 SEL1-like repeat protein [Vineibacter terrae]
MTDSKLPTARPAKSTADTLLSAAPAKPRARAALAGLVGLGATIGIAMLVLPSGHLRAQQADKPPTPAPGTAPTSPAPAPNAGAPEGKPEAGAPPSAGPRAAGPPLPPSTAPITEETLDLVKRRANAGETEAMEELARRYLEGAGVKVNATEGAGWLQRAADRGAPGAMYNIAVMYERGIIFTRSTAKALEWYTKAAIAGVPMAMHNLALMYRDGSGVPADPKRAVELLQAAARSGMSASMYALGVIYDEGSYGVQQDLAQAVVWYAMALQFQRANPATQNSELAARAQQKMSSLQLIMPAADLKRAQAMGETEFRLIVDTIRTGPKVPSAALAPPPQSGGDTAAPGTATPAAANPADAKEQLIEVQKLLSTLRLYNGKPDGLMGPGTRNAIKAFQRSANLPETGETSQALVEALRQRVEQAAKKK